MLSHLNKHTTLFVTSESPSIWHRRLAHTNNHTLNSLISSGLLSCNKDKFLPCCNACQIGKHIKLPFHKSLTQSNKPFEIIHSDVWTSPVHSLSGCRYYVLFLDDFSHYLWVYPLRRKSDVFSKFLHFSAYVRNQFKTSIKTFQCDNGGEYDNSYFHDHFSHHGIFSGFLAHTPLNKTASLKE